MTLLHFQSIQINIDKILSHGTIPFAFHFYSIEKIQFKNFQAIWMRVLVRQHFEISVAERYLDTIWRNDWNKRENFSASVCLLERAQSFSKSGRRDSPFLSASRCRMALCASEATKECSSTEWRRVLWSSLEKAACRLTGLPRPA